MASKKTAIALTLRSGTLTHFWRTRSLLALQFLLRQPPSSTTTAATLLRLLLLLGVPSLSAFFSQLARKQASKAKPSKASNEASMAIAAAIAIASTSY